MLIPPPAEHAALLAENRRHAADLHMQIGDLDLAEFRHRARRELTTLAADYTHQILGERLEIDPDAPLVISGHQPEFYHVGVWVKNFLLHRIATGAAGRGINLVVDNDALKHTALAVPVRRDGRLHVDRIAFEPHRHGIAFEEDAAPDRPRLRRFVADVHRALATLGGDSAFGAFAERFLQDAGRARNVPEAIVFARRRWEAELGLENLELPIRLAAETESFRRFVLYLVGDCERIVPIYNAALAEYRRLHGITNRANPMPDLAADRGFFEVPLWIWRAGGQRQRLEAQRTGDGWALQVDDHTVASLAAADLADPARGVAVLAELSGAGFRIRPRALTLTWFMHLLVGDLFIHGIGGTHYETITDEILRQHCGVALPRLLTASGTLWMDLPRYPVTEQDARDLAHLARDLTYNPQRHLPDDGGHRPLVRQLVRSKQELIAMNRQLREEAAATGLPERHRSRRRELFTGIRQTNRELLPYCDRQPEQVRREIANVRRLLADKRIAEDREYFFALLPPEKLESFLLPIAGL
jgi:hypothetical protein